MNPETRAYIEKLEKRIEALERVENISFIQNIRRRISMLTWETGITVTGTTESVRNSADTGSETVAKDYSGAVYVSDGNGNRFKIGHYGNT
jgi:hypothetical protein